MSCNSEYMKKLYHGRQQPGINRLKAKTAICQKIINLSLTFLGRKNRKKKLSLFKNNEELRETGFRQSKSKLYSRDLSCPKGGSSKRSVQLCIKNGNTRQLIATSLLISNINKIDIRYRTNTQKFQLFRVLSVLFPLAYISRNCYNCPD